MHLQLKKTNFFQEAKSSCAGQWYLPAGRMEPGEDIVEAVKREVLEETGIHFEPSTLLLVESAGDKKLLLLEKKSVPVLRKTQDNYL